jgi:glycine cleavage system H lipoate-binding protein
MYTPTHEIVRPRARTSAPSAPSTSGSSRDAFVLVRVGLADRAFDEIGDVKAITRLAETGKRVSRGETVGVLKWEGFKRTASDELYHAVWANATGNRDFTIPFTCEILAFNEKALADPFKVVCGAEVGWIVECRVTLSEIRSAVNEGHLLSEKQYAEVCDAQEREQDAAASRAYP